MHFISPSEEWKWANPDPWSFDQQSNDSFKDRQEEKERNFAAYFKQQDEMKKEKIRRQSFFNKVYDETVYHDLSENITTVLKTETINEKVKNSPKKSISNVSDISQIKKIEEPLQEFEIVALNEKVKNSPKKVVSNVSDISQIKKIERPLQKTKIISSFVVSRYPTLINGLIQFIKEDGTCVVASEKCMRNSSLPWTRRRIKLNVYKIENEEITDWNWSYFVPSSEENNCIKNDK